MTGGKWNNHRLNWAALVAIGSAQLAWGQPQSAALPEPSLTEARRQAAAVEKGLPKPKVEPRSNFDLSQARQERFRKYLPKTWTALSQREPLRILALGDSVFDVWAEDPGTAPPAFPAAFARNLAARFFYTGGVYEIGKGAPDQRLLGPAITLRQLSRPGGGVLDVPGMLHSTSRQMQIDLVLICFGQEDAAAGMSPVAFARAVQDAVDAARKLGADVLICGPWLPMAQPAEAAWGVVRPLSDAVREAAELESILFADLGDLSRLLQVPEAGKPDEPRVFAAIERTYRGLFHEHTGGRFVPRESLHARLGQLIFNEVLDTHSSAPWRIKGASASLTKPDHLSLQFSVENAGGEPLTLTMLPLIAGGWKPAEATPQLALPPNGKVKFAAQYVRQQPGSFAPDEAVVRLPVLICAGSEAHVEDVRAPMQPLALVWNPVTLFNQESAFLAGCQIFNNSTKDISGTWHAEMGSRRLDGKFNLKPQSAFPLDLRFDLSPQDPPFQSLPLTVTVKAGGLQHSSRRQVEVVRNLGLKKAIPLRLLSGAPEEQPGATLQADADARQITLTCAVNDGALLNQATDGGPAWQMDVHIDARSYGKRLERGSTTTLRVTGSAADGPAQVHEISPWAFGTGYAAGFDPKEFHAALATAPDGRRLITLTLPKTYLYLHEWALENGNSQLGLNVRLTFRQPPAEGTETVKSYALSPNTKAADDVESLVVLELTTKPTQRMTVNVY